MFQAMQKFAAVALAFGLTAGAAAAAGNPNGVAVIIGNKTYQHERVPPVAFAHRDADAVRGYVTEVLRFDRANIIDLRDATKIELEEAFGSAASHKGKLWSYLDPAGQSDVVVYFSGHGVPGQQDGRGYLLPTNANPNYAEVGGYPIDLLYANLGKLQARSITVMLEACFSGDSPRGMLIEKANPVFIRGALPPPGRLTVLTAASGAQLASWDDDAQHGLFTNALLDALYGKADQDGDGRVTLSETRGYLLQTMTREARRTYRREQVASLRGSEGAILSAYSPDRPPVRAAAPAASPQSQRQAARTPAPAAIELEPIDAEFITVKNANLRDEPSVEGRRLRTLPRGTKVVVLGKVKGTRWYALELDGGQRAYVFDSLVREHTVASAPAPQPKPQPQASPQPAPSRQAAVVKPSRRPTGTGTLEPQISVFPRAPSGIPAFRGKMHSTFNSSLPIFGEGAKRIVRNLKEQSGSRIDLKLFEPGALVSIFEYPDALAKGEIEAAWGSPGYLTRRNQALWFMMAVPFGLKGFSQFEWVSQGEGRDLYDEFYGRLGVKGVPCGLIGPEGGGWFDKPIRTTADWRGKKIRFFGLGAKVLTRLGASAQLLAAADIYPALERGVIEASEFSVPGLDVNMGFHRIRKIYYREAWHQKHAVGDLVFSKNDWNRFSGAMRTFITAMCRENAAWILDQERQARQPAWRTFQQAGVSVLEWPAPVLRDLETAWRQVAEDEGNKNPDWRRTWQAYQRALARWN